MKFPTITIILRNVSEYDALKVSELLGDYSEFFSLEVALNSNESFDILKKLSDRNSQLFIGAGTVLNLEMAKRAYDCGAKFMLSPAGFSREIFEFLKDRNVIKIPGALSMSEILNQRDMGADIVKVFPLSSLGSKYIKDIVSPVKDLNLMAVGGVNRDNFIDYIKAGAKYVGIGSSFFGNSKISDMSNLEIENTFKYYRDRLRDYNE